MLQKDINDVSGDKATAACLVDDQIDPWRIGSKTAIPVSRTLTIMKIWIIGLLELYQLGMKRFGGPGESPLLYGSPYPSIPSSIPTIGPL